MSETYFVTGATGFIGRSLTRRLLESGARVKCLVRTAAKADWLAGTPNVEIINGDLRDGAALARGVEGVDGVFHVAGLTREVRRGEFMEVNCGCTLDLARYCVRSGRRPTLVVVSSLSCSGIARKGDALSGESGERLYDLCRRKREQRQQLGHYGRQHVRLPIRAVLHGLHLCQEHDGARGRYAVHGGERYQQVSADP